MSCQEMGSDLISLAGLYLVAEQRGLDILRALDGAGDRVIHCQEKGEQ